MRFTLAGEIVPKGRPRFNRATGQTYTPRETRLYENSVAWAAKATREKVESGPVAVTIRVYTARKKPSDLDNGIKSILDGLNGHAFRDDDQVVEVNAIRIRSSNPRVEITVDETEELSEE